jgi:NitT/TauT family transport system substrate-binding protein
MVPLEPAQMPDALESKAIDAYSAWEPTPSISLARSPKNRAIYRGMSTDWVVFSREFANEQPQLALQLVASYVRAINWMRAEKKNLDRAGVWVLDDSAKFIGKKPEINLQKATEIARKDLLDVPGAPAVPNKIDGLPPLAREFDFLLKQGKLASNTDPGKVQEAFSYDGLSKVQSNPGRFRTFEFKYDE